MRKIAIFYHLYQVGEWRSLFAEQFNRLDRSGLLDVTNHIHIGITGEEPFSLPNLKNVNIVRNTDTASEIPTVNALYEFCKENDGFNVLNLHPTGVSWTQKEQQDTLLHYKAKTAPITIKEISENKTCWRRYLEYFAIDKWEECNKILSFYDCVGTEWSTRVILDEKLMHIPHYAGNIWWAKSEYIKRLDWNFIEKDPRLRRWMCEFWIGSGNPYYYNFYYSGKNLYLSPIQEEHYKGVDLLTSLF